MIKKSLLLTILILLISDIFSQELNCKVNISSPKIKQTTDNQNIIKQLQEKIFNFVNNTKWTNEVFEQNEKIEMDLLLTIEKIEGKSISTTLQVQSRRPVFNSNYYSNTINLIDNNLIFEFEINSQFLFMKGSYSSELTSTLAFYCYLVIGNDFDTFSSKGGTAYYLEAQKIVDDAKANGNINWIINGSKTNRYWLIDNILNESFVGIREFLYTYHYQGLDVMHNNSNEGINVILSSLNNIYNSYKKEPSLVNIKSIFNAKSLELYNVFSKAEKPIRLQAFNMLKRLDPTNITLYQKLLSN